MSSGKSSDFNCQNRAEKGVRKDLSASTCAATAIPTLADKRKMQL